jgi:NAD(P)-dependent dehydrogenase (short-subunit alcohol dehydrogenase family)
MKVDSSIAAVVTGGASGLGEATARLLAGNSARVALFDLNVERGEALAQELDGIFCCVDVSSEEQVVAGLAKARASIGQERILVNCAGIGTSAKTVGRDRKTGEIRSYPLGDFERIVQINLLGTFRCILHSAKGMLDLEPLDGSGRGVIINTASIAAEDGQIGQSAYAASKAGVVGMTLPIARDLSAEGIRVNTILPGIFNTPLMHTAPEPLLASLSAAVPFPKRLGEPSEYAQLALAMIENDYLNGEDVRLDGGIRMGLR